MGETTGPNSNQSLDLFPAKGPIYLLGPIPLEPQKFIKKFKHEIKI